MGDLSRRLDRLEQAARPMGCATCVDWPPIRVEYPQDEVDWVSPPADQPPVQCPNCGHQALVVQVVYVDEWPTGYPERSSDRSGYPVGRGSSERPGAPPASWRQQLLEAPERPLYGSKSRARSLAYAYLCLYGIDTGIETETGGGSAERQTAASVDMWRHAVAGAVHGSVARCLGPGDVWSRCLGYAIAGHQVLRGVGHEANLVVGELVSIPDPDQNVALTFNPDVSGDEWYVSGRYHAWLSVAGGVGPAAR